MGQWTESDPGAGDIDAYRQLKLFFADNKTNFSSVYITLQNVLYNVDSYWTGEAKEAWCADLLTKRDSAMEGMTAAEALESAVESYIDVFESIQDRANKWKGKRDTAKATADSVYAYDSYTSTASPEVQAAQAKTFGEATDDYNFAVKQLKQLGEERQQADDAVAAALCNGIPDSWLTGGQQAIRNAGFTPDALSSDSPAHLLDMLTRLNGAQQRELLKEHPELAERLLQADPATVSQWWNGLTETQQSALITNLPSVAGALNGIPPLDRVAANRLNAQKELDATPKYGGSPLTPLSQEDKDKAAYLQSVVDGKVQLYLYDPANDRIIEMLGTPGPDTTHVITYVPGTFAGLEGFYSGSTQRIAEQFQREHPGTVAFVYKDGQFPGSILQANDIDFGRQAGEKLAKFQDGINQNSYLAGAKSSAIGHSWGTANVTSSEVAGAHYDDVISLSGAWMPPAWEPDPTTSYTDYSYLDILQQGQATNGVGEGRNPRNEFDHGPYYGSPDDADIALGFSLGIVNPVLGSVVLESHMLDNHNLVATTNAANQKLLTAVERRIFG